MRHRGARQQLTFPQSGRMLSLRPDMFARIEGDHDLLEGICAVRCSASPLEGTTPAQKSDTRVQFTVRWGAGTADDWRVIDPGEIAIPGHEGIFVDATVVSDATPTGVTTTVWDCSVTVGVATPGQLYRAFLSSTTIVLGAGATSGDIAVPRGARAVRLLQSSNPLAVPGNGATIMQRGAGNDPANRNHWTAPAVDEPCVLLASTCYVAIVNTFGAAGTNYRLLWEIE